MTDIIEGNRLIAEFMGAKKRYFLKYRDGKQWKHFGEKISDTPFDDVPYNDNIHPSGKNMTNHPVLQHHAWQMTPNSEVATFDSWLEYHSSWDWLMPVVENIEAMGYVVYIGNHDCKIWDKEVFSPFNERPLIDGWYANYVDSKKITTVWNAVVEFIKWYNQNK